MKSLTLSSCMAPNMDFVCHQLADYLAERLPIPVRAVMDIPWQDREHMLDIGAIDLCWICGLPYIWKADRKAGKIEPLVAPVMSGRRYQDRPIYFSDVVVHRDSAYERFADLRGTSWAYNEPGSHSGYGIVRYVLALQGETLSFFNRVIESGSHQNSMEMILRKEVDGSAIDSTVLEQELTNDPKIADQIRVLESFGPSPIPPWVISKSVPGEIRHALLELFTQMNADLGGQKLLKQTRIARFTPVDDRAYDPIRRMASLAFGERFP